MCISFGFGCKSITTLSGISQEFGPFAECFKWFKIIELHETFVVRIIRRWIYVFLFKQMFVFVFTEESIIIARDYTFKYIFFVQGSLLFNFNRCFVSQNSYVRTHISLLLGTNYLVRKSIIECSIIVINNVALRLQFHRVTLANKCQFLFSI